MNTPTPRTDPYEGYWATKWINGDSIFDHAKKLETELTASNASLEVNRKAYEDCATELDRYRAAVTILSKATGRRGSDIKIIKDSAKAFCEAIEKNGDQAIKINHLLKLCDEAPDKYALEACQKELAEAKAKKPCKSPKLTQPEIDDLKHNDGCRWWDDAEFCSCGAVEAEQLDRTESTLTELLEVAERLNSRAGHTLECFKDEECNCGCSKARADLTRIKQQLEKK